MPIFQSILVLNRLPKSIALVQKSKNAVFQKFFLISKWHKKNSKFKSFTGSSLTLWPWWATSTSTRVFRWQSILPCTHVGRAWERRSCFEESWTNFLKMLVLTLNSIYLLRYSSLIFFIYIFSNFSNCSHDEWIK